MKAEILASCTTPWSNKFPDISRQYIYDNGFEHFKIICNIHIGSNDANITKYFIRFRSVVCDKALCIVFGKKYTKANFILFYIFYNKLILASYMYYIKIIRLHEKDKIEATFNLLIICR